jgi:asparagine synthetase B (glutamine-hydrolysing)
MSRAAVEQTRAGGRWVALWEENGAEGIDDLRLLPEPGYAPPAVASREGCTVLLDGVLHDRTELLASVPEPCPADVGDAELILRAYLRLGSDVLRRIDGVFALVIRDGGARSLLCARDAVGVYPLFYLDAGGRLAVSTAVESLVGALAVSLAIDRVIVAGHLYGLPPKPDETFFENVRRLPAGHVLRACGSERRIRRYWDPAVGGDDVRSPAQAVERLEELLRRAIRRRANAGPFGVFLSGGVDSATVAALTAEVSRERGSPPPLALSLVFRGLDCDEEVTQRAVADGLGLRRLAVSLDEAIGRRRLLRSALELSSSSFAAPTALLQPAYDFLAREARRRGCPVVLTGDGGDEWLLPSPSYAADRLRVLDLSALYALWHAWHHYYPVAGRLGALQGVVWKWGARPLLRAAAGTLLSHVSPPTLSALRTRRILAAMPPWLAPDASVRRELIEWANDSLPVIRPGALYEQDKRDLLVHSNLSGVLEQAFADRRRLGVHVSMPLLDADVTAFLYRLQPALLIRGGTAKSPARELLGPRLPGLARTWPRTVYGDSLWQSVMTSEGAAAWRALDGGRALSELGIVDRRLLGASVDHALSRGAPDAPRLWEVMNLETWLRSHMSLETTAAR